MKAVAMQFRAVQRAARSIPPSAAFLLGQRLLPGDGRLFATTTTTTSKSEGGQETYTGGLRDGMPVPGDYTVREMDEEGHQVGVSGPDPQAPRGMQWHKQEVEHAMGNASDTPPADPDAPGGPMSRRSPGGPTAEELDPLRPHDPERSAHIDPKTHVAQRVKKAASAAWDTLKHGVNTAGQPQIVEELKQTAPEVAKVVTGEAAKKREGEGEGGSSRG